MVRTVDYKGRVYDRFHVRRNDIGPGWAVFGRNPEYGDTLVSLVSLPGPTDTKLRRIGLWNSGRSGFRLKRTAQAVADRMNSYPAGADIPDFVTTEEIR